MTKMSLFSDRIKSRKHKEERTQDQKNTMKKIDKSDIDQHGANRYIYRSKDKGTITKYASDKETAKKEIDKEINVDFRDEKSDVKKWAKEHPNFITPNRIKLRKDGNYFIELSEGRGFNDNAIYGVSLIHWDGEKFTTQGHKYSDRSKSFSDRKEAEDYYKKALD